MEVVLDNENKNIFNMSVYVNDFTCVIVLVTALKVLLVVRAVASYEVTEVWTSVSF